MVRAQLGALGPSGPMPDWLTATPGTTRQLLDGAIALAEREAPDVPIPPMTAPRWAWQLIGQWYCAHHSVALLPALAERFAALGRPDLAAFARRKLEQEAGHDEFPLADLRELGYDASAAIRAVAPPPAVAAAVAYARWCVDERPVEFVGYVYALERRILRVTDEWFGMLAAALPPAVEAASFVRAHATELDARHVAEGVEFIAGLPAPDRARIVAGCLRATEICCAQYPGQHPSELELDTRLQRFRRVASRRAG